MPTSLASLTASLARTPVVLMVRLQALGLSKAAHLATKAWAP